jgi:predicted acylesterase/phospholipase RssA
MTGKARSALVFQGGGALGAYELGAARALYEIPKFAPDLIAGVSIGAITAALLARPADQKPTWLKAADLARTWDLNQLADRLIKLRTKGEAAAAGHRPPRT